MESKILIAAIMIGGASGILIFNNLFQMIDMLSNRNYLWFLIPILLVSMIYVYFEKKDGKGWLN